MRKTIYTKKNDLITFLILFLAQVYADVIHPSDLPKEVPLDRHTTLRVFCRWIENLFLFLLQNSLKW